MPGSVLQIFRTAGARGSSGEFRFERSVQPGQSPTKSNVRNVPGATAYAQKLRRVRETGAGILLDVENLYLNASNHGFDPYAFLDGLPLNAVKEVHVAGGVTLSEDFLQRPLLQDTHSHPVPEAALDLLDYALARQSPATIVLERDDRLEAADEILADVARLRARYGCPSEA